MHNPQIINVLSILCETSYLTSRWDSVKINKHDEILIEYWIKEAGCKENAERISYQMVSVSVNLKILLSVERSDRARSLKLSVVYGRPM